MQGRVALCVLRVGIGTGFEQRRDGSRMPLPGGEVQGRVATLDLHVGIDAGFEQRRDGSRISGHGGPVQGEFLGRATPTATGGEREEAEGGGGHQGGLASRERHGAGSLASS